MYESLGEAIKVFVEKHLIPSLISVALSILCILFIPSDYWVTQELGKTLLGVFCFCVSFTLIHFFIWSYSALNNVGNKIKENRQDKIREKKKIKENLEKMWDFVDSLPPEDRAKLKEFLNNENKPVEMFENAFDFGNTLLNSNAVVTTAIDDMNGISRQYNPPYHLNHQSGMKKVKLKDDFYRMLKYSQDEYGRISHFE